MSSYKIKTKLRGAEEEALLFLKILHKSFVRISKTAKRCKESYRNILTSG